MHVSYPSARTPQHCAHTIAAHLPGVAVEVLPDAAPGSTYLLLTARPGDNSDVTGHARQLAAAPHHYGLLAAVVTTPLT